MSKKQTLKLQVLVLVNPFSKVLQSSSNEALRAQWKLAIAASEEEGFVDCGVGAQLPGPDGHLVVPGVRDAKVPEFPVVRVSVAADHLEFSIGQG